MPEARQSGRTHKQILDALASRHRHINYVVLYGSSAGYALGIACQILWAQAQHAPGFSYCSPLPQ